MYRVEGGIILFEMRWFHDYGDVIESFPPDVTFDDLDVTGWAVYELDAEVYHPNDIWTHLYDCETRETAERILGMLRQKEN